MFSLRLSPFVCLTFPSFLEKVSYKENHGHPKATVPKAFTQISAIFWNKILKNYQQKTLKDYQEIHQKKKDGLKGLPSRELTYPPDTAYLKMMFLFPRWDMLVSLEGNPFRPSFFFWWISW